MVSFSSPEVPRLVFTPGGRLSAVSQALGRVLVGYRYDLYSALDLYKHGCHRGSRCKPNGALICVLESFLLVPGASADGDAAKYDGSEHGAGHGARDDTGNGRRG